MKIDVTYSKKEAFVVAGLKAFICHLCPNSEIRANEEGSADKRVCIVTGEPSVDVACAGS